MAKNLILFGAGASYGSDINGVPPLGSNLFDELCLFNPSGWGSLPQEFKTLFLEDFEQGIVKVSNERPYDLPILQRVMASYFFNFLPQTTSLYFRLANKLVELPKDITISTLNYERLLELALSAAGHQICVGNSLENQIELIFPHGCCHFFCESARADSSAVSFAGLDVNINGEIKIISDPNEHNERIMTDAFPPVLSYFEPQKRATSGQDFLMEQRGRFLQHVIEAEVIIIVGVKIRDHDVHIWDAIKNSNCKLIYCSGSNEMVEFEAWINLNRANKENLFIDGYWADKFEDLFDELI